MVLEMVYALGQKRIGSGSQGSVYLSTLSNIYSDVEIAVKVYRFSNLTSKERETLAYQRLGWDCPHILKVWCSKGVFDQCDLSRLPADDALKYLGNIIDTAFIFLPMELCESDLLTELRSKGQFSPQLAQECLGQVLDALVFAHHRGVAHGDVKPGNILVEGTGYLRLADWGSAKIVPPGQDRAMTTRISGTDQFLAPEFITQYNPQCRKLTPKYSWDAFRADAWSFGILIYCTLTGVLPFHKASLEDSRFVSFLKKTNQEVSMHELVDEMAVANFRRGEKQLIDTAKLRRKHQIALNQTREFNWPSIITIDAIDVIKKLLTVNPNERIRLVDAGRHPFFANRNTDIKLQESSASAGHGRHPECIMKLGDHIEFFYDKVTKTRDDEKPSAKTMEVAVQTLKKFGHRNLPFSENTTFPLCRSPKKYHIVIFTSDIILDVGALNNELVITDTFIPSEQCPRKSTRGSTTGSQQTDNSKEDLISKLCCICCSVKK